LNAAAVEFSDVSKSFGHILAVNQVSFEVQAGEIFGLLGPNGAGKTSIIRLVLGILTPDSGRISILGGSINASRLDRIGYLPEERGLYQDISVEKVLIYLASLKGLRRRESETRLVDMLDRMDLGGYRKNKVKELSKGMQQKVQIIASLLHEPELLILDEPFSALDPINTQMIKSLILELTQKGVTVILSTHQLNHAEELCDRILLIQGGNMVLNGKLTEVVRGYSDHAVWVRLQGALPEIPGVVSTREHNRLTRLELETNINPQFVLEYLVQHNIAIEKFEIAAPSLEEIFMRAIQQA
jgi:ABC-2 type transport system ATP-binding protein